MAASCYYSRVRGTVSRSKAYTNSVRLLLSMWLAQMESTITSASVITITNDLGGYIKNSWILTAYWLTSGALQIIWAKLSDIYGRKETIVASLILFSAFSGACGGSQTVTQLIMFRWLQGVGGCGIMALGQLVFIELVPPSKYPLYIGIVTAVLSSSLVCGPLIGGGITMHGHWRWVFLVNVPVGVVILAAFLWIFPRRLIKEPASKRENASISSLKRIDFVGGTLLLGTCLLLTTGLQQASIYRFDSALVLPLLVCTAPFLLAFLASQWFITTRRASAEPVFPWRFCTDRVRAALVIITLLNGGVLSICVVQIPQRFMTLNGMSAFSAAARLLAFGAFVPTGSSVAVTVMSKLRISPAIIMALGATLQISGAAPLSRAPTGSHVEPWQYVCQVLIGLGVGFIISAVMILIPKAVEEKDLAVAMAAQSQFRILGGLIAVSISATITTRYLQPHIRSLLPDQLANLLLQRTEAIQQLSGKTLAEVRVVFGEAYNREMYLAVGLAAACLSASATAWRAQQDKDATPSPTAEAQSADDFITKAEI
ncbi:MFS general substrate transporter [Trematosphaeria pertusa]|uniref:MFS general substrate transporter n=1 Tax=Trematosphaeria pertusa TaxID=390896 RepID=A0A6A6IBY6_9PLEO|nr:MFS general substrate transporter [Trematosphaeria pertusa]KAF2248085.1 MFS general substrate transporter [Trematosphaeria pertusa]